MLSLSQVKHKETVVLDEMYDIFVVGLEASFNFKKHPHVSCVGSRQVLVQVLLKSLSLGVLDILHALLVFIHFDILT